MEIRVYQESDCEETIQLFRETVVAITSKDYTASQISVWAGDRKIIEPTKWNQSLLANQSIVMMEKNQLVGFADMASSGYLDRLYVHKEYQGMGIARKLVQELEGLVKSDRYSTHASITARPFFERMGYRVVKENDVRLDNEVLRNYIMEKEIIR
ncbi:GNAT family N-acetyltransferase [Vagococcus sp. PNs007]|uniref:GNAT family N-acetyltransferase n=1 Tax=Vagococcus proximus TaxID=2991417 RepID=A0ABT5X411_9ENTE|nr:GNAT family N-acetyltransferase [Vagococcus proximus]